ncbi:hypothetical protein PG996_010792 [Apiospora saccharicola]|uniref:Uncharacterized protein n=1 Tax=Apiospora saccharicola TaxID=335842 RepID=A0ABR1UQ89_9PEZI
MSSKPQTPASQQARNIARAVTNLHCSPTTLTAHLAHTGQTPERAFLDPNGNWFEIDSVARPVRERNCTFRVVETIPAKAPSQSRRIVVAFSSGQHQPGKSYWLKEKIWQETVDLPACWAGIGTRTMATNGASMNHGKDVSNFLAYLLFWLLGIEAQVFRLTIIHHAAIQKKIYPGLPGWE